MAKLDDKYINTIATSSYPPEYFGKVKKKHETMMEMDELRERIRMTEMLDTAKDLGCQPIKLDDSFTGGYVGTEYHIVGGRQNSGFSTLSQREFDRLSSRLDSNILSLENGSTISIIDTDGSLLTRKTVIYSNGVFVDSSFHKEEKEMTKIERRIEELEQSIVNNKSKLEELRIVDKYSDMAMEISSQLSLINSEKKLLKGYETLDNMEIGNVIINNETVIVISIHDTKAISKLSDDDEFNFLAGFFLCLTKLGNAINTDWYDYSIHAALEDIELGNL